MTDIYKEQGEKSGGFAAAFLPSLYSKDQGVIPNEERNLPLTKRH